MREAVYIPARYASRRLPGKCLMDVGGRPVLAWAIDNARDGCPDRRIIVMSEDNETLRLAESLGCEVVAEPEELARADLYEPEMVGFVNSTLDDPPEICVVIYGNLVFGVPRMVDQLAGAIRIGYDYAQAVAKIPNDYHPWRVVRDDLTELLPGRASRWSQHFPELYVVSSAGMAFHRNVPDRLGGRCLLDDESLRRWSVIHDPLPVGDIDTSADLETVRRILGK